MLFDLFAIVMIISSVTSQRILSVDKEYEYWRNCIDDTHCQRPLVCSNNKCVCPLGRLWKEPFCENITSSDCSESYKDFRCRETDDNRICDKKLKKCLCRNQTIEDAKDRICKLKQKSCKMNDDCKRKDANSLCDKTSGRCACLKNFYYDFKVKLCQPKLNYDIECDYHYQCNGGMLCQRLLWASSGRCQCPIGWRWSEAKKVCQPTAVTIKCTIDNDCQDPTTDGTKNCVSGKCQCQPGYRLDSNGNCNRGGGHYKDCYLNTDCQANMTCDYTSSSIRGSCGCDYGYQWSKEHKKCLLFSDALCQEKGDCTDKEILLNCTNQKCTCEGNRVITKYGRCLLKLRSCQTNKECPSDSIDKTENSIFCNQDLKKNQCTCKQKTYVSRYNCLHRRCNPEHPCHSDDYSNDKNMYCTDYGYCDCKHGVDATGRCNNKSNNSIFVSSPTVFYIVIQSSLILIFLF